MAFSNLGFEAEDAAAPGLPDVWTTAVTATAEEAAGFDDGTAPPVGPRPAEAFEGDWSSNEDFLFQYADPIDLAELDFAVFDSGTPDPESFEDFEDDWPGITGFLFALGSVDAAGFDGNTSMDSAAETYSMSVGDQLSIQTDLGGPAFTDAVAGTAANHQANNTSAGPPIGFDSGGETFRIHYNGRGSLDVTVDDTDLDVNDVALGINQAATLAGVAGEISAGIINPGGGFVLFIQSDLEGYNSSIAVENVSHVDTLQRIGFDVGQIGTLNASAGSGNIALIDAVLASDVVDIVNGSAAVTTLGAAAVLDTSDDSVLLHSPPDGTIRVNTTAMGTAMGFALDTTFGPSTNTSEDVEDMDEGWSSNEDFLEAWVDVVAGPGQDPAQFDVALEDFEDFEEEWGSNQSYQFSMGSTTAAQFDATPEPVEDFEEVLEEFLVTVSPGADTFTKTAHGLSNGETVMFRNEGGALPAPISPGFTYFVVGATANTFQVSATSGGAAINLTDSGFGDHYAIADRDVYWTSSMKTI